MPDLELAALSRTARRDARLPIGARCAACRTDEYLVPQRDGRVLCYADGQVARGASGVELDHIAGRANFGGLVVPLGANSHRKVTDWRLALGMDEWPTAGNEPLLLLAHLLAGIASLILLAADWLVAFAAHVARTVGSEALLNGPAFPVVP